MAADTRPQSAYAQRHHAEDSTQRHNGDGEQSSAFPSPDPSTALLGWPEAPPSTKDRHADDRDYFQHRASHAPSAESLCPTKESTAAAAQRHALGLAPPGSRIYPDLRARPFWRRKRLLAVLAAAAMFGAILLVVLVLALRATAVCPVVQVQYGRYAGTPLPNGISQWLGMRYAAPPVGDLRFRAPRDPESFVGVRAATAVQPGCAGMGSMPPGTAEDCLFLDVYAPTGARPDAGLPVFVWIQGGGLQSAAGHTNGSALIRAANMSMIVVSMTYRVGAFGFLASPEVHANGDLNNGLRDQRQALRWVQNNIRNFGGDPHQVTVGGQSAGAGSVLVHLVAKNGSDEGLFQRALMESPSLPPVRPFAAQQFQYDGLVARTKCTGAPDTLACLRTVPAEELIKKVIAEPYPHAAGPPVFSYNPVLDGDLIADLPVRAFATGHFVRVPTLLGSVADEGTIFAPRKAATTADATTFLKNTFPAVSDAQMARLVDVYALDPAKPPGPAAPGPFWHRASLAYGELRYTCATSFVPDFVVKRADRPPRVWSYQYAVLDPAAVRAGTNVSHGAELPAVWGPVPGAAPRSLFADNKGVVPLVQGYWTSFIRDGDPNPGRAPGAPTWDAWTGRNRMRFVGGDTRMQNLTDAQLERCRFLKDIAVDLQQ